jgi:hypothetical protein
MPGMVRLSLRQVLALVALAAVVLVSLKYASDGWLGAVGTLAAVAFCLAAITALVDRGPRQAAAIGFLVVAGLYGYLVMSYATSVRSEFGLHSGRFPTTLLLRYAYLVVEDGVWMDSETGQELPNFDPAKQPQRTKIVGNSVVPIDEFVERPPEGTFVRVGHLWWMLLLGYAGGRFATFVYGRRRRDETVRAGDARG